MFAFRRHHDIQSQIESILMSRLGLSEVRKDVVQAFAKSVPECGAATAAFAAISYQIGMMCITVEQHYNDDRAVPADLEHELLRQVTVGCRLAEEHGLSLPQLGAVLPHMCRRPCLSDGFRKDIRPLLIEAGFAARKIDEPFPA